MLRDRNLITLSHQHQHALALCVRLERALQTGSVDVPAWQQEIEQHFTQEIQFHFAAEESWLFPAARGFPELAGLVDELLAEHQQLRGYFARAGARKMNPSELAEFAKLLSGHIRKEERQLFEALQKLLPAEDMKTLGEQLKQSLESATQGCILPPRGTARTAPKTGR
ncbi:MAG: hemerythrin domain-containing protein [Terriglobales bacterium]